MNLTIDALGDKCPVPVVKAKKALGTLTEGTVEMLVDNETSVRNLENLADSLKCTVEVARLEEQKFRVLITKDGNALSEDAPAAFSGSRVIVFSSDMMGTGDDGLGATLMKAFVFAVSQQDVLPDTMLFYNGGAKLTVEGSECLADLGKLADAGVEILTCGTCLKHYGIEDKLAVGTVTNMYVIVEKQMEAGTIIRP